VASQIILHKF